MVRIISSLESIFHAKITFSCCISMKICESLFSDSHLQYDILYGVTVYKSGNQGWCIAHGDVNASPVHIVHWTK